MPWFNPNEVLDDEPRFGGNGEVIFVERYWLLGLILVGLMLTIVGMNAYYDWEEGKLGWDRLACWWPFLIGAILAIRETLLFYRFEFDTVNRDVRIRGFDLFRGRTFKRLRYEDLRIRIEKKTFYEKPIKRRFAVIVDFDGRSVVFGRSESEEGAQRESRRFRELVKLKRNRDSV
ncbi:MAG: hypothetical protein AAGB46_15095 [Verrucomicrobiota bacterium]